MTQTVVVRVLFLFSYLQIYPDTVLRKLFGNESKASDHAQQSV